jgi:co-chaperonin GroES (HSP10)
MKATSTTVIFRTPNDNAEKKSGSIYLTRDLNRDTHWVDCLVTGPESILKPGDKLLVSKRITSSKFEVDGTKMENTSDASVLGYKRNGELGATAGTILYEWVEPVEETTESGIVIVRSDTNKEIEVTRRAYVHAAGPKTGLKKGDIILLNYNKDSYKLENIIEGRILHNVGIESVICFWPA